LAGHHTITETERQVENKLGGLPINFTATAAVSNIFRGATAVRNQLERTVLRPSGLSWTAFVVMWVVWVWEPIETRAIASEGGFSKATLTGVLTTLEARDFVTREKSPLDGRLVLVRLTDSGRELMENLFPKFNAMEEQIVSGLTAEETLTLATLLRKVTQSIEGDD
jgi:DNA-binding MarR family transcriptional regulator